MWVDYSGTIVTNKEVLENIESRYRKELFNNPKILMLDDSDIEEKVRKDLETKMEDEENEYEE